MKLGFILEPNAPNSAYRVIFPMMALERRGHEVLWPRDLTEDLSLRQLASCDLVHCFRRPGRAADLKMLSSRGVAISFDNDDDLAATDASSSGKRVSSGARGRLSNIKKFAEILKISRWADLTTTPSPVLADKYRNAGARHVAVIENYLDAGSHGFGKARKHPGVTIGWMANKEHQADLPNLTVVDHLERLLDRHDDLRVISLGIHLPLNSTRYEHRARVPFHDLLDAIGDLDIGIAPLSDTAFNRARSNIKLKEYGAVGAMWAASPVGAYTAMDSTAGGVLVHEEDWFASLDAFLNKPFRRGRLARRAFKWAKGQTTDSFAEYWENEFLEAIERAHTRRG